jgi:hypothetical protein
MTSHGLLIVKQRAPMGKHRNGAEQMPRKLGPERHLIENNRHTEGLKMNPERPGQTEAPRKRKRRSRERGKVKHGGYAYLVSGVLPKDRIYLKPYLTAIREGLIHDHAAREEDLPAAKRILIDQVVTNLGVIRLIQEHVRETGIFQNPSGFLSPTLGENYLRWLNAVVRSLALLGVERKAMDEPLDLQKYIADADKRAALESHAERRDAGHEEPQAGGIQAREGDDGAKE